MPPSKGGERGTGLTGAFDTPEDSERCRSLTAIWARNWPDSDPIGYRLRAAYMHRWVRFHNLPESKRYAETPREHAEIIRRQHTILGELLDGLVPENLVVIAEDWDVHDLASSQSRQHVPDAWSWRRVDQDVEVGPSFFWVHIGLAEPQLNSLLRAIADDQASAILGAPDLSWLFCPYDGGVNVILPDAQQRDALRDRHRSWLSTHPSGL